GGRARQYVHQGFTFDIGPTFYWMPDIFDSFFADFDKQTSDYYQLDRLNPGYEMYYGDSKSIEVSADLQTLYDTFEREEKGSGKFLKKFLNSAEFNYKAALEGAMYKPGLTPFELISAKTVSRAGQFTTSISSVVRKNIKNEHLAKLLEFPVIFLGAQPKKIPAFYCFMNYADMVLGTWYPKGGFYSIIKGMAKVAEELGVKINTNSTVEKINIENKLATGVIVNGESFKYDAVITGADYHHSEYLIEEKYRNYNEKYWSKKTFAPSALLFYVGFDKKIKNIKHHTLFFDSDFDKHIDAIYNTPEWPEKPLFYTSFPSLTDSTAAPEGKEAGIFLIPLAPGLIDNDEIREKYFNQIIERMEKATGQEIRDSILFKKSFGISDFMKDYNAYKGNAYGLANTLSQTAFLKPKINNKKVKNLFYTGQLTVPGPGVPSTIISGKIAATVAHKKLTS
ncbi:MAG: phytoene desaturase family protein, partial [Bacteroidales bacterium]|nr:phytoene desaturase family protein [Bacteroidales bacterium]